MRKSIINLSAIKTIEDVRKALFQLTNSLESAREFENKLQTSKFDSSDFGDEFTSKLDDAFPSKFDTRFGTRSIHGLSDVGVNTATINGLLVWNGSAWTHQANKFNKEFYLTVGNFDGGSGLFGLAINLDSYTIHSGNGCAILLPENCRLAEVNVTVRHNTSADPGPWLLDINKFDDAANLVDMESFEVDMSVIAFGYNTRRFVGSLEFPTGNSMMDVRFSSLGGSADFILMRAGLRFTID